MRTYEVIFIIRPDLPEAETDALVEQMQQDVTGAGGQVTKLEKWGKRPMAYRVSGQREGYYVLFEVEGTGQAVHELERRLKVAEPVIKSLTVRVDLERKKVEKLRHRREHRAARKQQRTAAAAGTGGTSAKASAEASAKGRA